MILVEVSSRGSVTFFFSNIVSQKDYISKSFAELSHNNLMRILFDVSVSYSIQMNF